MTQPVASFSGISSGVQWRDMIDQIMSIEAARRFDPLALRQGALRTQSEAWKQFQGIAIKFRDAARAFQAATAFDLFSTSGGTAANGRALVSVSAGTGAQPGSYSMEVLSTARAEKIGGAVVEGSSTQLGVSGSFALNGRTITVSAEDTLVSLRDKINATTAGAGASGVSATILSVSGGARLVLTAQTTGAAGIEMLDDGAGTLGALGFTDGTAHSNIGANGAARTNHLSSSTAAIATLLGVPLPTPSTIRIGGQAILIDLEVDSITTIAAKIAAATGNADSVRVMSEKVGTSTRHWIETDATVEVDPNDAEMSARTLAALGFTREGRSDIAQVVSSSNTFFDQSTNSQAEGSALLSNLTVNGQSLAIGDGDVITIGGTRGDGTAVTHSFAVNAGTTLQDLLSAINDSESGFGSGIRTASAGVDGGRITLADQTAGDSSLGLTLTVTRSTGGTVSLGAFSTDDGVVGRSRVIASGADALVRVDGQLIRSATNTITGAIAGTTVSALAAQPGETVTVNVERNADAIAGLLQEFAAAYNAVRSWVTTNSAPGGALAGNSALRSMAGTLTSQLLQPVVGITGDYTSAALVGLQHDRNGVLSLDVGMFKNALQNDLEGVRRLFTQSGSTTDFELEYITAGELAAPTATGYAVEITQAATLATVTGASFTNYATTGTADTVSITDASTGRIAEVLLSDGDDIQTIVNRMNSSFATQGLRLSAERTVGDQIRLVSLDYGTEGGFTVAYTPGDGGDGTALLGIAAGEHTGLDVAGMINGALATGRGQMLTGARGDASEGLVVRYTGTTARSAGSVGFSLGIGGALARAAGTLASDSSGAALYVQSTAQQADAIDPRLDDIQKRLDARRDALIRQFVAMEGAMAKAQALGDALIAQINSLNASSFNNNRR